MLNNLLKTVKKSKKLGRGRATGKGKTSGRGQKGQKSRSGYNISRGFEGGQTPLKMRLPKNKGFKHFSKKNQIVKTSEINKMFKASDKITKNSLIIKKLINSQKDPIKILFDEKPKFILNLDKNILYSAKIKEFIKK